MKMRSLVLWILACAAISIVMVFVPDQLFGWNTFVYHAAHTVLLALSLFAFIIAVGKLLIENKKVESLNQQNDMAYSLLHSILQSVADGILVVDLEGKITFYNERFIKLWGVPKHIVKKRNDLLMSRFVQEKLADPQSFTNNTDQIYEHQSNEYFDNIKFKDGRIIERYSIPQYNGNKIVGRVWSFRDITKQKDFENALMEREEIISVLLSSLPGMAYRCSFAERWYLNYISQGCYELTGYQPEDLLSLDDLIQLVQSEYRASVQEAHRLAIRTRTTFKCEFPILTANGEVRWVFEQGQGIYDARGDLDAIKGIVIDITERKEKENELKYMNYHDVLTGLYNRRYYEQQLKDLDEERFLPLSIIIGNIDGLKITNDTLGHTEGDKLILDIADILKGCCREGDTLARTAGDEFCILMPNTVSEVAEMIIKNIRKRCDEYRSKAKDRVYHASISLGCATKARTDQTFIDCIRLAEENMYKTKLLQSKSLHSSVISSIQATLLEKSQETKEHAQRMITLSKAIGAKAGLNDQQMNELVLLAVLHDIGKIGVNDSILKKPDRLSDAEWVEMKKHPEIGYRIAMASADLMPIANYILCHHEHWDGSGYPQGLKGDDIPLLSRIISVIDAFDAMTQDRAYGNAISKQDAINEIIKYKGIQFDPAIADIFINTVLKNF